MKLFTLQVRSYTHVRCSKAGSNVVSEHSKLRDWVPARNDKGAFLRMYIYTHAFVYHQYISCMYCMQVNV